MAQSENTANVSNDENLKPVVYAILTASRGYEALTFTKLKEPHKYPNTQRRGITEIMQKLPLVQERGIAQP